MHHHISWNHIICSVALVLILISIQGSNSQIAEVNAEYELTTEHRVLIEKSRPTKEYVKIVGAQELPPVQPQVRNENPSLDDTTIDDFKVISKEEMRPETESRVVMPLKSNTQVKAHKKSEEALIKHAVEHLEDDVSRSLLPKKIAKKQTKNAQYDEVSGEVINGDHPCQRACKEGEERMICYYHFSVEWYQTMSKACFDCPYNISDCYRKDCIPADGMNRALNVINRKMPGPSIQVCQHDRVIVDVENDLMTEATTIHWHGQHQRGTPYMDGMPYVTQCPILPETSFRYQFNASQVGTHFWHSHFGMQRADGMAGAFIVRAPKSQDPHAKLYHYDRSDHVILLIDWIHELTVAMFMDHYHSSGDNSPRTILVNGVGRFRVFNDTTVNAIPTYMKTARFNVFQGYKYRFRVINAGILNCPIEMSIDGHNITIISSDGYDLQPITATSLVTYAGERFDFVVTANNAINNYWIRIRGLMSCDDRFTSAKQLAVLHYEGATDSEPYGDPTWEELHTEGLQLNALNKGEEDHETISVAEMKSVAGFDDSLKEVADYQFYVSYDFYPKNNSHYHKSPYYGFYQVTNLSYRVYTPQLNHISMKMLSSPLLLSRPTVDHFCNASSIESACRDPTHYCECPHVLSVKLNSVVEVVLIDEGVPFDSNHPFHLHGQSFRVVGMRRLGNSTSVDKVKEFDASGLLKRNLRNAPIKDTVTVPDGGYTVIRFKADNPGYWIFHCHIEFHVEVGMALVFKVGAHEDMPPVPRDFPTCGPYLPDDMVEHQTTETPRNDNRTSSIITNLWPIVVINSSKSAASVSCLSRLVILSNIWLLKFAIGS